MKNVFPESRLNRSLGDWANDVNTLVETLMGTVATPAPAAATGTGGVFSPKMDIRETASDYIVSVDLPGVKQEDADIEITEDHLVIHGKRSSIKQTDGERYHRVERTFGDFRRTLRLPQDVNRDKISAEYEDGVLTVHLPKATQAPTARKIEINKPTKGFDAGSKTN
jgi:HSP20 family protein